jgi:DNA repair protein RecO (recombination protein O)
MPGSLKTEAIVLRSIRYGEGDRVLHLYTPRRGRLSFFRLDLVLYEGRGDMLTVTSAETSAAHGRLRADGRALDAAARACDAVARLFEQGDPNPATYHLLANELALLDADPARGAAANQLAFRLKLLLAAGLAPHLAACASCGEADHLTAYSGAAGGVVCAACEGAGFALDEEAYAFLVDALSRPLAEAPAASERALRQAERAIAETVEHHGHVRWRPAAQAILAAPG